MIHVTKIKTPGKARTMKVNAEVSLLAGQRKIVQWLAQHAHLVFMVRAYTICIGPRGLYRVYVSRSYLRRRHCTLTANEQPYTNNIMFKTTKEFPFKHKMQVFLCDSTMHMYLINTAYHSSDQIYTTKKCLKERWVTAGKFTLMYGPGNDFLLRRKSVILENFSQPTTILGLFPYNIQGCIQHHGRVCNASSAIWIQPGKILFTAEKGRRWPCLVS